MYSIERQINKYLPSASPTLFFFLPPRDLLMCNGGRAARRLVQFEMERRSGNNLERTLRGHKKPFGRLHLLALQLWLMEMDAPREGCVAVTLFLPENAMADRKERKKWPKKSAIRITKQLRKLTNRRVKRPNNCRFMFKFDPNNAVQRTHPTWCRRGRGRRRAA